MKRLLLLCTCTLFSAGPATRKLRVHNPSTTPIALVFTHPETGTSCIYRASRGVSHVEDFNFSGYFAQHADDTWRTIIAFHRLVDGTLIHETTEEFVVSDPHERTLQVFLQHNQESR